MEKRIAAIIRWLERSLEAHKAGELESALMDVECAQADMDILRDGVWSGLDRRQAAKRRRFFVDLAAALFKVGLGAACAILATATPLALPPERHWEAAGVAKEAAPKPAAVSERENQPARTTIHMADKRAELPQAAPQSERQGNVNTNDTKTNNINTNNTNTNLSYENILALVQTGEKALKNERPAIEIEIENRRGF
jgi:hypothetical protein